MKPFILPSSLIGIICGLFILTSASECEPTNEEIKHREEERESGHPFTEFVLRGHNYIKFGQDKMRCIVHDPDCKKCKKNSTPMYEGLF